MEHGGRLRGRTSRRRRRPCQLEWLPGRRFLIERWDVPVPEAPDGIAVIGADPGGGGDGGRTIAGTWEICHDGETWGHDFDLTYTREA